MNKDLSVRAAEAWVKAFNQPFKKKKIKVTSVSHQVASLENQLIELLGTKVKLKPGVKGGSIEISYFSDDDLEYMLS